MIKLQGPMSKAKITDNVLDKALHRCRGAFIATFFFAFAVNVLMLAVPLYSLQVYDRVISSGSMDTLVMLTVVILGIFVALNLIQVVRSFTLIRIGEWLDKSLSPIFFANSIATAAVRPGVGGSQNLRDLSAVRSFLTSAGINTLFDAPWSIVYIAVIFMLHPALGYLSVWGGIILFIFAVANAYATNNILKESNEYALKSMSLAEIATRNAESVEAMGMMSAVVRNWHKMSDKALDMQSIASNRNGIISGLTKFFRLTLQIAVTGLGAYYVLHNELTAGGLIASATLIARALSPFEASLDVWKNITSTKQSYHRLKNALLAVPVRHDSMALPVPHGRLSVENVFFAPPSATPQATQKYTLKGVSFTLEPGEILAIVGPSAAGKSTLAKLITGVWKPLSGIVRLDSADVYTWHRDDFGQHTGYMPQGVELFNGTVKDNIARMNEDAAPEDIVEAAKMAGVHDMVLRLPNGYETDIGIGGTALSAGQRQRVGLARAFFGNPKFVVLDEPNANLDETGDAALVQALVNAKNKKITTIIISHRPTILANVDKIMVLNDGAVSAFGPRNEIMEKFTARANPSVATPQSGQIPAPARAQTQQTGA
jgi:PrtD family type I secretion system ABC transporter